MAHAVETTHQRVAFPHLDTLGQALVVELAERGHEGFAQPSALLSVAILRRAATVDHAGESRVEGHTIAAGVSELAHGVRDVHLVGAQHKARTGRPPIQFAFAFEGAPRENARRVGGAQAFGAHVAADGQKTIGFGQLRVGEEQRIGIENENHSGRVRKELGVRLRRLRSRRFVGRDFREAPNLRRRHRPARCRRGQARRRGGRE